MKTYTTQFTPILIVAVFAIHASIMAQFVIRQSVFGNGGMTISDSLTYRAITTLGQTFIGQVEDEKHKMSGGFYYMTGVLTAIDPLSDENLPGEFRLDQNYPNPFNPITTIQFTVPKHTNVKLQLYDLLGRKVGTLVDEELEPGEYKYIFNASGFASGVYFYHMEADRFIQVKKLILLK
jgi:hypothetical protein